ncbi:MAG: hypothetical protein CMG75_10250 [Candidatus Marinimicrobia bacterium]|nr:hypothetical protein [Candidatus Neomarinimicrobiota bacterium]
MTYIIWLIFFSIIFFFCGVLFWTLRSYESLNPEDTSDTEEWICPSCSFNVQVGTECIYCGEKKPVEP